MCEQQLKELMIPVAEVETVVSCKHTGTIRVRLKGQRPENKCLLAFSSAPDLIETIHDTKKRGGTVWVRFNVDEKEKCGEKESFSLKEPELVVRDFLE